MSKKKKKAIRTIMIIILVIALILAGWFIVKIHQLNKIPDMQVSDVIDYMTADDDEVKISIAIIKDDEITYQVYGKDGIQLKDTNYDYEIGSISKTFTALLLARAIDEGKVDLQDSISKYLDLEEGKYYPTIERLVTHTSGYKGYYFEKQMIGNKLIGRNDFYSISKEQILSSVMEENLEDKDYEFKYSNFGFAVLGLVLEEVYAEDYCELVEDLNNDELKLKNTKVAEGEENLEGYWEWQEDDGYIPAGALISNIEDMGVYLKFCMEDETSHSISPYHPLKNINATTAMYEKMSLHLDQIGLAWIIDEQNNIIWHNGGTDKFNSYIAFDEERETGVVVLGNLSPSKKIPMTVLGEKIMAELKNAK